VVVAIDVVTMDVVTGVATTGGLTVNVSGLVPPQFSMSLPGCQLSASRVSGPE